MKKLFISTVLIGVAVSSLIIFGYYASRETVSFHLAQAGQTVTVYSDTKKQPKKITSLSIDASIKLRKGAYYYTVTGERYDPNHKTSFSVGDNPVDLRVDPDYSAKYLATLVGNEVTITTPLVKAAHPRVMGEYDVSMSQLFKKGEWMGVLLKKRVDPRDLADDYRLVLHKENGSWVIVHHPEIIVTKYNNGSVPIDVLSGVNRIKAL